MSKWRTIRLVGNSMTIYPAIQGNTKILINNKQMCEINGTLNEQIDKIKSLIWAFDITELKIDTVGFGMAFYDEFSYIYEEKCLSL